MSDIRAQLLAAYADEHREHLAGLRAVLGAAPDLEEAYRHAHTLKGAARAVDLPAVEAIAHRLETLLQAVWEGRVEMDQGDRRVVARALDAIEDASAAAIAGETPRPAGASTIELDALLAAHGLEVETPRAEPAPAPATGPVPAVATFRVEAQAADRLVRTVAGLLERVAAHQRVVADLGRLHRDVRALQRACRLARHVSGDLLDRCLAEVCAHAEEVAQGHDGVAGRLTDLDWALERLADEMRADVQHLRLVSADSQFGGYARMVRDIAADQGKEVEVVFSGLDTRGDREVLQPLSEAVMHLLRNATTHGIEPPNERMAAGKPPAGRVRLAVTAAAGRLDVAVGDDGRGIDPRALAARAVDAGLLSPEEAERASPDVLRHLVFEPGLSTAGAVTAFAGRGMGMSIVRKVVTRLQGLVEVRPGHDGGTVVAITVPVTIIAQPVVLVTVRGHPFALPAAAVTRLAVVPTAALTTADGGPVAVVDGEPVRLADLGAILGLGGTEVGDGIHLAVMRAGRARLGLVVGSLTDVRDLPVAALEAPLADDPLLGGTVTVGAGPPVLVLAPQGILSAALAGTAAPVRAPEPRPPPLVLVVDDSITTRTLEKSILETHGYRVVVAVDGFQALDVLAKQRPDVVVTDIEMPRLDGFDLLASMRRSPALHDIPVVLVTSCDSEADRERGMRLGADAFIVKARFDQDDLLEAIGRLA